jgi:hypothetical protein
MSNPSPRPALRKAEDATIHPAAPRPVRAARAPKPAAAAPVEASAPTGPRTIADTNRDADAAAQARATKNKGKRPASAAAPVKAARKKHKFSGSTSDHMRVPDTEFVEHPKPKGERRGAAKPIAGETTAAREKQPAASGSKPADLMSGKVVDLGARVPKKLRAAAKAEAKRRGLDLDAVTSELLYEWLEPRR